MGRATQKHSYCEYRQIERRGEGFRRSTCDSSGMCARNFAVREIQVEEESFAVSAIFFPQDRLYRLHSWRDGMPVGRKPVGLMSKELWIDRELVLVSALE